MKKFIFAALSLLATPVSAHEAMIGQWAITGTTDYECAAIYYSDDGKIALNYDGQNKTVSVLFSANSKVVSPTSMILLHDGQVVDSYPDLRFYEIDFDGVFDYDMDKPMRDPLDQFKKANQIVIVAKNRKIMFSVGNSTAAMDNLRYCAANHRYGQ